MCLRYVAAIGLAILFAGFASVSVAQDSDQPEHRFVKTNGIKLRVASMGEGPPVIFLHGFPESWYSWRHQLPAIAKAGYQAIAPDLRGYGESDKPENVEDYQISALTADIVGLLDAMGEEQAVLVGHDWGALIGWAAMLQHPDRFKALVALSVPYAGRQQEPMIKTLKRAYGENFYYILYFQEEGVAENELNADPQAFLKRVYTSPDVPKEPPKITDPKMSAGGLLGRYPVPKRLPNWLSQKDFDYFVEQFSNSGFRGPINYYRNFDHFYEVSQNLELEKVKQPVLFIAGEGDPLIGGASAEQLKGLLAGGTSDLQGVEVLSGVGHWVNQEKVEETNQLIIKFLEGLK